MYRQEGLISLYRGVLVNIVAGNIANFIFFGMYANGKVAYGYGDGQKLEGWPLAMISLRAALVA